ncbi:GNAT family N-acetyltransferase [Chromobacterium vaccinii]|uniref:GNAT family N-acetyltransferase n=1 Tax=Chromobacterium vaccinii TaxID=1108595 RepID=A0A1D9LKH3_9NEIS|nr:GNAT family N-acetyltransferase [Chromobacterium vaccinii]AOZ51755.1 GNAT family N-acetyltransferase [Chromobacterium vaccinii]QND86782.1 GNAT family N-acetyltransferase [Chromobacterium vaccinii]QND92013.1 GNAT family N-acetyltransferase [Chromobacterium vaccinii]
MIIRPVDRNDYQAWRPLWDGYNAFYGRAGETALPENITRQTWARFLDDREPVDALVAELDGKIVGLAHTVIHRSTTRLADVCYLQDLFTAPEARGQGVARALIDAAKQMAAAAGCNRLYWQTHQTNQTARALYDKVAEHQGFIVYGSDVPA